MVDDPGDLTKLHIDLPNHWKVGGEAVWARQLGDDLYEITNVPFCAYGLNFFDIVKAHSDDPDLKPEILEVVQPSGHKTLRLFFDKKLDKAEQERLLTQLQKLDTSCERADKFYVAIDVHPEAEYQAVCDKLFEWEQEGLLAYETCEARVPGSFDDEADEGLDTD